MDKLNRSALTDMAGSILRPLIAVLMRNKFTHSELTELVRQTYVEVAYNAFSLPNKRMTYSRAALLSGLSRKEVVRLYNNIEQNKLAKGDSTRELQHHAKQTMNGWLADRDYLDSRNEPKELSIDSGELSFSKLVAKYCGDVEFRPVLDELTRLGIALESNNGVIRLVNPDYIPQHNELENIRVMSVCVSDLFSSATQLGAVTENDIKFQRQLVYSGIEATLAQRFHEAGSEKAMALFDILNEFLSSGREQSGSLTRQSKKRVGLGIYYFEDAKPVKSVKMTSEEHA